MHIQLKSRSRDELTESEQAKGCIRRGRVGSWSHRPLESKRKVKQGYADRNLKASIRKQ